MLPLFGIETSLPSGADDPGVLVQAEPSEAAMARFIAALGLYRHTARETDPPAV